MSYLPKNAYTGQLGTSATLLYTAPANTRAMVSKCIVANDTTTVPTFTFYKVPSGGSAGVTNLVVNGRSLGDSKSDIVSELEGAYLDPGDMIYGLASVASQVTCHLDVLELVV